MCYSIHDSTRCSVYGKLFYLNVAGELFNGRAVARVRMQFFDKNSGLIRNCLKFFQFEITNTICNRYKFKYTKNRDFVEAFKRGQLFLNLFFIIKSYGSRCKLYFKY